MVECKQRYTMDEFYRWKEYERLEPFGEYWLIQQVSVLCAVAVNALGGVKRKPQDFLPEPLKNKHLSDADVVRLKRFFEGRPV